LETSLVEAKIRGTKSEPHWVSGGREGGSGALATGEAIGAKRLVEVDLGRERFYQSGKKVLNQTRKPKTG